MAFEFLREPGERLQAGAVDLADLVGREGVLVDPQVVEAALEELAAAGGGTDERHGLGVVGDLARPAQRPDFLPVEIDPHELAVERGRNVVPAPVEHLGRVDRCVALLVAADVQAQGEDRAVLLVREQEPLGALAAEDLAEAREIRGSRPRGEGDLGDLARLGTGGCQGVITA
ncbi:MAG: hypothetical protein NUV77_00565 [Thermoguttaceae bacterium]|nr:hypothetical protein [Thermoguttaceae bacterium]